MTDGGLGATEPLVEDASAVDRRPGTVTIVAEAGVNHNGSLQLALELVDAAADAGADIVKFQTFVADRLVTAAAPKAEYQQRTTDRRESQRAMLRVLELDADMHRALIERCRMRRIEFMSTPFDERSLDLLVELGVGRLKIPSGEITNGPLLLRAARSGLPIILSTGMSDLAEVEEALGVLAFGYAEPRADPSRAAFAACFASAAGNAAVRAKVTLLHCTTEYPAAYEDVNLLALDTLAHRFGTTVGYSDHTPGITVAIAAAARGARVIEKHLTLDRTLPGPDHKASIEPDELRELVRGVRIVEAALGSEDKRPMPSEIGNRRIARKSLVAGQTIAAGAAFTPRNLAIKRPGTGRSPMEYWDLLGRAADRPYRPDELI